MQYINTMTNFQELKETDINQMTFLDYYFRLKTLACSMFEWEGLPNGIDERFLEKILFEYGKAVFINDPEKGFMIAKVTPSGEINVYDEPIRLTAYGIGYQREFDNFTDCVLIRNNDVEAPTDLTIRLYAWRLANCERTIDVNIHAQKTPVMILCDEKQRLTLQNLYKKYQGNEPVIFGDKSLNADGVKVLKTDAPMVVDQLTKYKHDIYNEVMTFLGINNANLDKKERMVTNEVDANNEQVQQSAICMLKARQRACDLINDMYGLNISVKMRKEGVCEDDTSEIYSGIENVD